MPPPIYGLDYASFVSQKVSYHWLQFSSDIGDLTSYYCALARRRNITANYQRQWSYPLWKCQEDTRNEEFLRLRHIHIAKTIYFLTRGISIDSQVCIIDVHSKKAAISAEPTSLVPAFPPGALFSYIISLSAGRLTDSVGLTKPSAAPFPWSRQAGLSDGSGSTAPSRLSTGLWLSPVPLAGLTAAASRHRARQWLE